MEKLTPQSIMWRETAPGVFSRHLDRRELILRSFAIGGHPIGKSNLVVCTAMDYSTSLPDIADVFQQAWMYYRILHPHVADELQDVTRVFDSNLDPKKTAAETFFVENKPMKQVFSEIKNGDRARMHLFPKENKLLLTRGHDTCDGRGHLYVWNEFLEIAQAISEGTFIPPTMDNIASRLAPAWESITGFAITEESMKAAGQQLEWLGSNEHCLPSHNLDQPPSENNILRGLQFSEIETSAALRAIKERGATVAPVVQAAVGVTSNKIAGTPGKLASALLSVDVRRYCGADAKQPLTNYFAGLVREYATDDFDTAVKSCVKGYSTVQEDVKNGTANALCDIFYPAMLANTEFPGGQRTYVDMSSPGIIEDFVKYQYGDIEVKDLRLFQRELFAQCWFFWSTWKGKFAGTLVYNDRYHTVEEMDRWLTLFKEEFLGGLGIKQDMEPLGPF